MEFDSKVAISWVPGLNGLAIFNEINMLIQTIGEVVREGNLDIIGGSTAHHTVYRVALQTGTVLSVIYKIPTLAGTKKIEKHKETVATFYLNEYSQMQWSFVYLLS
ncbi:PREDICTED: uncharacterized protein LOC18596356 [Theobroma cacao]|uniref:Uncharacterized protein LOC18596356 n=1 Tax=Theobroma cacao TaxID=3641 RepID=A0AB32WL55_THECC|nr:PREDICTED: uncharacterized protein LOC18596356 [Theobroma cacao]